MPQVEVWYNKGRHYIDVPDPVPEYVYLYPPLEPMTYCGDPGPPQNVTIKMMCYEVFKHVNTYTGGGSLTKVSARNNQKSDPI